MKKLVTKRLLFISVLILGLSMLVGCSTGALSEPGSSDSQNANKDKEPAVVDGKQGEEVAYEVLALDNLSEDLKTGLGFIQEHNGYGIMKDVENGYIVYIGSGEKPTAGYGLEIESVIKKDGLIKITVKETQPDKDDLTAQVITYPTKVIKIKDTVKNLEVVNTDGKEFKDINAEEEEQ